MLVFIFAAYKENKSKSFIEEVRDLQHYFFLEGGKSKV